MSISEMTATKKIQGNEYNGRPQGLKEDLLNAEQPEQIECPKCNEQISFIASEFYWRCDDDFEFCDVKCPECGEPFELNAAAEMDKYTFFTCEN